MGAGLAQPTARTDVDCGCCTQPTGSMSHKQCPSSPCGGGVSGDYCSGCQTLKLFVTNLSDRCYRFLFPLQSTYPVLRIYYISIKKVHHWTVKIEEF